MRVRITPGASVHGSVTVPGDKSIAHRWLILAATASGPSRLVELPGSLDVRSTASCLAAVTGRPRPALEAWASNDPAVDEGHRSTWNLPGGGTAITPLELQGEGREGLVEPVRDLDCGNAGTAMRLLSGVMAAAPFRSRLTGDPSLSVRPMERVAVPLREMGATVRTSDGHAPLEVEGGALRGIRYAMPVPSAQVKGALLLAGLAARGPTTVEEPAATRDHTERALRALGAPVRTEGRAVTVEAFQHAGFDARCPGDVSSAAFLVAAAGITASALTIRDVGLNPSRIRFLDVMARQGIHTRARVERTELGEPVGEIHVTAGASLQPVGVEVDELPLVIDEIPVLALVAAHAHGDSRFSGAGELRLKESDRLSAIVRGVADLGGRASVERDDLILGGGGLAGGTAEAALDHRMAMALVVGALAAGRASEIGRVETAEVSFPGFVAALVGIGARIEVLEA